MEKVSILCLTYNRPALLEECIFSVLQQSYQNFELIIINDCPQQQLIFEHEKVKIINLTERFSSLSDKRNFALSLSKDNVITFVDDDDLILPHYLEKMMGALKTHVWLYPQRCIVYYNPKDIYLSKYPVQLTTFFRNKNLPKFELIKNDEIFSFYDKLRKQHFGTVTFLKNEDVGYVYRKFNEAETYSAFSATNLPKEKYKEYLINIKVHDVGKIHLTPKWNRNYTQDILENISNKNSRVQIFSDATEVVMDKFFKEQKHSGSIVPSDLGNSWKSVKMSWEKASSFLESANSRGLLSTTLNVIGVDQSLGERVPEEVYIQRKMSCFGNDVHSSCKFLKVYNDISYCGACGCGANKLARLNTDIPNGYTKLHYPHLECPLKKKGFSNYEKHTISIIMTALNEDPNVLQRTIQSIRDTAGEEPEIIVVDDFSNVPVTTKERVIRNETRLGVGGSRHRGAQIASHEYLLFTDAHMIFENGWYENALKYLYPLNPNMVYCGTCLGLNDQVQDLTKCRGTYYGAELLLHNKEKNSILEGKWTKNKKDQDNYEISCMMGAMYFIPKELYFKVRGFSDLKMWGSSEPCISTKIWLAGGEIRLLKTVRAGHIFRNSAPYSTQVKYLIYNKIRLAKTILPKELGDILISKLPMNGDLLAAYELIEQDKSEIKEYAQYYKSVFSKDIYWLCKKFNIEIPS